MWKISSLTDDLAPLSSTDSPRLLYRIRGSEPMILIWWCFALATLCSSIVRFYPTASGVPYVAPVIAGSGACAWFWFLSRALFRERRELGLRAFSLVPMIVAIEAAAALMPATPSSGIAAEASRIIDNAAALACIAAIAFVWREALYGYTRQKSAAERRFRQLYVGSFSLLVAFTMIWMSGARPGSFAADWQAVLLTACAALTLLIGRLALHYRLRHPLAGAIRQGRSKAVASEDELLVNLSGRILQAMDNDELLTTPNLKVAQLAEQIGEQEYKVTRCITSHLQYRNFNHLLNTHRIERAKRLFHDPTRQHLTIACIAYDCGYNSLGPFNRAFRQHTGVTPREYRQQLDRA